MSDQSNDVRRVFDDWARRGRAEGMERGHRPVVDQALRRAPLQDGHWFLDVGCGNGYVLSSMAPLTPNGTVVGVDISPEMVARSRAALVDVPNVRILQGAFPDVDLPRGRFDVVFSMEVFYYLPDLDGALRHTVGLLRPGGTLLCVVDFYRENPESHGWPEELGVAMDLRSEAEWSESFVRAGFVGVEQARITVPGEGFRSTVGSLLTLGRRAA